MKNFIRVILLLIFFEIIFTQNAQAETITVLAGEAVITKENYELLAYKELTRISGLLITDPVNYMTEYNKILEIYADYLDKMITIYDLYTEEDIQYLERCVETETFGGDFLGKVNVAHVIMNRVDHPDKFPSTVKDVVTASGQFAYSKTDISPLTIAACEYAAITADTTMGALWFHSGKQSATFQDGEYIMTDSIGHHFYR